MGSSDLFARGQRLDVSEGQVDAWTAWLSFLVDPVPPVALGFTLHYQQAACGQGEFNGFEFLA